MEWTESIRNGWIVARLSGEIDLSVSPKLRALLQEKSAARAPRLVLDLSEVRYIDSSGLATLVEYYKNAQGHGGKLALAGASARVTSILELVRLNEVFPIFSTVEDATLQESRPL